MFVYHGSDHIVSNPQYGVGKVTNDYGQGFYCTASEELAYEWAVDSNRDGYANTYDFNMDNLNVMDLSNGDFSVVNWIAILINNREFQIDSLIGLEAKEYISRFFLPELKSYDVIRGYRADDSYFSFAKDFLNNTISLRQLAKAMYLGDLGEQIVLKSPKAFKNITYMESHEAKSSIWYPRKQFRDESARKMYRDKTKIDFSVSDIYVRDILKEEMKNEDIRLQ